MEKKEKKQKSSLLRNRKLRHRENKIVIGIEGNRKQQSI